MSSKGPKTKTLMLALMVVLVLRVVVQLVLVLGFVGLGGGPPGPPSGEIGRDLKDWVSLGPSRTTQNQVVVAESGYLLASCDTENLSVAVARVRTSVVYITGHPAGVAPGPPVNTARPVSDRMGSGIIVDSRPGHVRVSPHFYNLPEEIDFCLDALAEFPSRG